MQKFHTYEKIEGKIIYTGIKSNWEHYTVWLAYCGVNTDTAYVRNEIAPDGMPTPSITWYAPSGILRNEQFGISFHNLKQE